jgi:hypothetical protein
MRTRALLLLTGIALAAASGFAQDKKSPASKSVAQPGSDAHRIAVPAVPGSAVDKDQAAGKSTNEKKQRIRYTFPPAAAKRM